MNTDLHVTGCKRSSEPISRFKWIPLGLREEVLGGDFGVCSVGVPVTIYPVRGENPSCFNGYRGGGGGGGGKLLDSTECVCFLEFILWDECLEDSFPKSGRVWLDDLLPSLDCIVNELHVAFRRIHVLSRHWKAANERAVYVTTL